MEEKYAKHIPRLKFMYWVTIFAVGVMGVFYLFFESIVMGSLKWTYRDPIMVNIYGAIQVAMGVLSVFGLKKPLRYIPVLMIQLIYKILASIAIIPRLITSSDAPRSGWVFIVIYLFIIIADLWAIPWKYVFGPEKE